MKTRTDVTRAHRKLNAFTLIELLIVVAIIAVLAAIAVPNFLEAQVRAKVARVKSDMRSVATAIESYRIDNNGYPEGTDNALKMDPKLVAYLGVLAPGFYALRTTGTQGEVAGTTFFTLTTPVAYISKMPNDPFADVDFIPFAYRNAKAEGNGWILTSVGPDTDLLAAGGKGDTDATNPLSTATDTKDPSRIGDINERAVIHFIEGTGGYTSEARSRMDGFLARLTYDPTNGTTSNGDIFRMGGRPQ